MSFRREVACVVILNLVSGCYTRWKCSNKARFYLLRIHPSVRACQLNRYVSDENVQGLAIGRAAMLGREQYRSRLFVAFPRCEDTARRLHPAAMIDEVHDAIVFSYVEIPSVARSVTAVSGVLHRNQLGHTGACWQVEPALVDHNSALVPVSVKWKQDPIVIVNEGWFDFILHLVRLSVELRAVVRNLDRLAVLTHAFKGDLASLGLPLPLVSNLEESCDFSIPCVADRLNLVPRIDSVGLSDLFENRRALLRPGTASK